ncbi:MAG: hypothetical protein CR982_01835 [Candidatus Cloacimonadota bacterium]|nr:MAG: hypothetical protein CR982_01835 [Candidatus Cloacimonadota bacterium]PIE79157.1 MAG: hypothetical protein CSA15_04245 [Candidatus Delongbacteria bacterium]
MENIPFENSKYNFFQGFYYTIKLILTNPRGFFEKMHVNKGFFKPSVFFMTILIINTVSNYLYIKGGVVQNPFLTAIEEIEKNSEPGSEFIVEIIRNISDNGELGIKYLLMGILLNIALFWGVAYIWHLLISIFGVARNGFEASFRVLSYSFAPLLFTVITINFPILNLILLSWVFVIISRGVEEAHEVTNTKGLIATISLPFAMITVFMVATFIVSILMI